MMKYHDKITELEAGIEVIKDLVHEKMDVLTQNNDSDEDPLGCDPLEIADAMKDFHDAGNNIDECGILKMISGLNKDQKRIFDKVFGCKFGEFRNFKTFYK